MAEALYRKYRPQVFEDVVGQEPIERTLKNAIMQDKVSHAYLFCGPRGTGKTTTARLLAKALLCSSGPTPEPDGTCEDCRLIADGAHPDVYELDAASRTGVENVREEIISRVQFAPVRGRSKVYIIDEVHMLSTAAFNALLKTLEEPPPHVVFMLCTTDPQKVPETIHSRCQRFDFRRIAPESMVSRLGAICMAEGVEFEGEALDLIAHRAEGGLRNALTSLEQIIAFENGKVTLDGAERLLGAIDSSDLAEIMAYIGKRDIANCFGWTANFVETGADLAQFVRDMAEHVRNLYVMALVGDEAEFDVPEATLRELTNELQWFGPDRASRLLGVLGDLSAELKTSSNPRLAFEIALTRMVRPDSDITIEALAERIEALESGYSSVAHVLPGAPVNMHAREASLSAPPFEPLDDVYPQASFPAMQSSNASDAPQGRVINENAHKDALKMQAGSKTHESDSRAPMQQGGDAQGAFARGSEKPAGDASAVQSEGFAATPVQAQHDVDARGEGASGKLATLTNPAALQRIWQATLSAVKKKKQAYGVLFMNTKARFDANTGSLSIVFPAESAFAYNAARKPDVQEALEEALAKAVGEPVAFTLAQAGAGASAPAMRTATTKSASETPFTAHARQSEPQRDAEQANNGIREAYPLQQQQQAGTWQQPQNEVSPNAAGNDTPYEDVPYEQVPYEDLDYDQVPYEDFDNGAQNVPMNSTSRASVEEADHMPAGQDAFQRQTDAVNGACPAESKPGFDVRPEENASEVEAMLKASFGNGVVFQETDSN